MGDKKEYVKLWLSYRSYFEAYSAAEVGRLVLAAMDYRESGAEPEFSGSERFIWPAIRRDIDESISAQKATSESRSESGKKGGRPSAEKANALYESKEKQKKQMLSEESKKSYGQRTKEKDKETILSHYVRENSKEESAEPLPGSTPPAILLPLNDGTEYPVSVEQCQEWAGLYPAVDVIQQLRQMKGWLDANPAKRKTKRGVNAFIVRWLAKEQDRGGTAAQRTGKPGYRAQGHNDELDPLERAAVDRLVGQPQRPLKGVEKMQHGVQKHGEELSAFQLAAIDELLKNSGEAEGGAESGE